MKNNNSVEAINNPKAVKTSLELARDYEKKHDDVLRVIKYSKERFEEIGISCSDYFKEIYVHKPNGKKQLVIEIDEFGYNILMNMDIHFWRLRDKSANNSEVKWPPDMNDISRAYF